MSSHVYTIPSYAPFVDTLAQCIMDRYGQDPLLLTEVTVLLPTQRACRALQDAFLRLSDGRPMLLPSIQPMGDIEEEEAMFVLHAKGMAMELPEVISSTEQRLLLTQLVEVWQRSASGGEKRMTLAHCAHLAVELSSFLADIQRQKLSLDHLEHLVPEDLASHWQITLQFLRILIDTWPLLLAEKNKVDPAHYRNLAIEMQCKYWQEEGYHKPVIAAGSTGSLPAVRQLLATVASLPEGRVVLPGLDNFMSDEAWEAIGPAHPQYGLKQLLKHLQLSRKQVKTLGAAQGKLVERSKLISTVMLPPEYTTSWQHIEAYTSDILSGLRYIKTTSLQEEAEVIALHLREVLEKPNKTAALITHERVLARKVATILARWGISIDDSAGVVINATAPAVFLRLLIKVMESGGATEALLSLLKHPLAAAGMDPVRFRHFIYYLEKQGLRGVTVPPGFSAIKKVAIDLKKEGLLGVLETLELILEPFINLRKKREITLQSLLTNHLKTAFALVATDKQNGKQRLLGGDMGSQLEAILNDMLGASQGFQTMKAADYMGLFDALLAGKVYRPRFGKHPRLSILSPLEARMLPFDFVILGGMNEGVWPSLPEIDPWMSRSMRTRFGLPEPERQIGLSAHDFVQMLGVAEILITRSDKVKGAQTLPSRWVSTLEIVLKRIGLGSKFIASTKWKYWLKQMHHVHYIGAIAPPAPTPRADARPQKLAVTAIERWLRDPYALYASTILKLKKLKPLNYIPSMAEFGTLVHGIFDHYIKNYECLRDRPHEEHINYLLDKAVAQLDAFMLHPVTYRYWYGRFKKIAIWFVKQEQEKRKQGLAIHSEQWGEIEITDGFMLGAKADRIEINSGIPTIIDYKTGTLPTNTDIDLGYSPQMILEGLIAYRGGFKDLGIKADIVPALDYWKMSGGIKPVIEINLGMGKKTVDILIQEAYEGLKALVEAFNDPRTPYLSIPDPDKAPKYSDYEHLARVKEWEGS